MISWDFLGLLCCSRGGFPPGPWEKLHTRTPTARATRNRRRSTTSRTSLGPPQDLLGSPRSPLEAAKLNRIIVKSQSNHNFLVYLVIRDQYISFNFNFSSKFSSQFSSQDIPRPSQDLPRPSQELLGGPLEVRKRNKSQYNQSRIKNSQYIDDSHYPQDLLGPPTTQFPSKILIQILLEILVEIKKIKEQIERFQEFQESTRGRPGAGASERAALGPANAPLTRPPPSPPSLGSAPDCISSLRRIRP